jgi:hypothetical protein
MVTVDVRSFFLSDLTLLLVERRNNPLFEMTYRNFAACAGLEKALWI